MNLLQAAFQHALAWTGSVLLLVSAYIALIGRHFPTGDTLFFMSALLDMAALIGTGVGVMRVWHLTGARSPAKCHPTERHACVPRVYAKIRVRRMVVRRPTPAYALR